VVVVQHERQGTAGGGQFVDEHRQHVAEHVGAGHLQAAQRDRAGRGAGLAGGEQEVAPEALGIVIAAIQ